jgi:tetratricopeptide (TPR) repeat protein
MFLLVLHFRSILDELFNPQPLGEREQVEQFMSFNQFGDAYDLLTKIISKKKAPERPQFLLLRAHCATKLNKSEECLADCAEVEKLASDLTEIRTALIYRSTANLQLGNFEAAEKAAKSANDKRALQSVADARTLFTLCQSQVANGQVGESKQSLDRLLRVCPKAPQVLLMPSDIAWMERDFANFPNDTRLHFRRGVVMMCADELN